MQISAPIPLKILWDGSAAGYIATEGLNWDEGELTITASEIAQPVTNAMLGALARVTMPSTEPYALFGRVIDVDAGSFTIEDPNGDLYDALNEIEDAVLTVFDHHDKNIAANGSIHTAGVWEDESITPLPNTGVTEFTSSTSAFPSHATGWFLQPDASVPVFFPIISATSGTLTVAGNLSGVAEAGNYYFIIPPVGIDKTDGTVSMAPGEPMTRKLAFGYQYTPPVAGIYHPGSNTLAEGIYGSQPGNNLSGQYYCWNRYYDPTQGRWTTPDPVMARWRNNLTYVTEMPTVASDPTGLTDFPGRSDWELARIYGRHYQSCKDKCEEIYSGITGWWFSEEKEQCLKACDKWYDKAKESMDSAIKRGWTKEKWRAYVASQGAAKTNDNAPSGAAAKGGNPAKYVEQLEESDECKECREAYERILKDYIDKQKGGQCNRNNLFDAYVALRGTPRWLANGASDECQKCCANIYDRGLALVTEAACERMGYTK